MQQPHAHWQTLPGLPLFLRPEYLDAVCGVGRWDVAIARDGEGRIRGIWPYLLRRRWGLRVLGTPPLSPWSGPWLIAPDSPLRATRLIDWQWRTYQDLLHNLPAATVVSVKCPRQLQNGMPFQRLGWQQRVRYSYVLSDLSSPEALWQGLRAEVRNKVRKAESQLTIELSTDTATYWRLAEASFRHRKAKMGFEREVLDRLVQVLYQHGCGQMLLAVDNQGQAHAGQLICWDQNVAYNQLLVSDPLLRQSGAASLLLWKSIEQSAAQGRQAFDFSGSHLPGIEEFLRAFGGAPEPYYWLVRRPWWLAGWLG